MSIVIEYLENIRKLGLSGRQMEFYEFLLENGKSFEYQIYENDVPPFIRRQQCFNNSFLMATCGDDSLEYYEGFYVCGDIPIPLEHAFNLKGDAVEVSDFTAQKFGIPVVEWFGVQVPKWILAEWFDGDQNTTPLQYYYQFKKLQKNGKAEKNQSV